MSKGRLLCIAALAVLVFVWTMGENTQDRWSGRSLLQLYSTGTETISMGPNGMTSSGTFEMGYMNTFKEHVKRVKHRVTEAAKRIFGRDVKESNDQPVTKEMIDAYVNKPSTLKKKGWTHEIAKMKAEYYYQHHDLFLEDVHGKFDAYDKKKLAAIKGTQRGEKKGQNTREIPLVTADQARSAVTEQHVECPVARCMACQPGQQTEELPEVKDENGCPRLCNYKCLGEVAIAKEEKPILIEKEKKTTTGSVIPASHHKPLSAAVLDSASTTVNGKVTEERATKKWHKISVVRVCVLTVVVVSVFALALLIMMLMRRRRAHLEQQYRFVTNLDTTGSEGQV